MNRVTDIDNAVTVNHVLISVFDKTGLETLVRGLLKVNPEVRIYSTGGTYKAIDAMLDADEKRNLIPVSEYTGQPEMQGGLVKTLDFKIYLGMLSETYNEDHKNDLGRTGAVELDMVVVNLYPFREAVAGEGAVLEDGRANIDIGGPCMVRASAKNYLRVASVSDPADYPALVTELETSGGSLSFVTRFSLAKKSFAHTAAYDTAIAEYLAGIESEAAGKGYVYRR